MSAATVVAKQHSYPAKKVSTSQRISQLAEEYSIIGLAKLTKMRSQQINALRKKFRGKVKMLAVKNKVAALSLSRVKKPGMQDFVKLLEGPNMLLFTNLDPFELALIVEREKVELPARPGDVVAQEVMVAAGNTGIPPGPVLSEFKEVGVPTKIEGGSIWVSRDTIVAKPGDVISPKLAGLLGRLGLKPIKAGLLIESLYWDGRVVPGSLLKVSTEEVTHNIALAFQQAIALSVESGYPSSAALELMITGAARQALMLAIEGGYATDGTTEKVLATAFRKALELKGVLEKHGYR